MSTYDGSWIVLIWFVKLCIWSLLDLYSYEMIVSIKSMFGSYDCEVITNTIRWNICTKSCCWGQNLWSKQTTGKKSYHNQHPIDQCLLLAIEVFGCLYKQVDMFLHDCANAMWNFETPKDFSSICLDYFFPQKFSITLQRM